MTLDMPPAPVKTDRPLVMLVDDDRLVLLILAHGLRQAGFEVVEADNGDDAILLARARRPDLALLDIRMQGLSGFDVAQHLKDYELIPFMFISAFADEEIRRQAQDLGALACLTKPVDMPDLVRRISQALQTAAQITAPALAPPAGLAGTLDETAVAVGLIMHRESVGREAALRSLQARVAVGQDLRRAARQVLYDHELAVPAPAAPGPASTIGTLP